MKQTHLRLLGATALCGSLLMAGPSSFAGKALSDEEMDKSTAAGQPRVQVGNGNQEIIDNSLYDVTLDANAQTDVAGDSIVNTAGENNIGVAQNVANVDGGGEIDQINEVNQARSSRLDATDLSLDGTSTSAAGESDGSVAAATIGAQADHIKVGHGDQLEDDNSVFTLAVTDEAQQNLVAFSLVNAAGRNNVGVALNAANRDAAFLDGGAFIVTQLNTINHGN